MPTLLPFRDYSEHNVVNLFAVSGSLPVSKGTVVRILGNGWKNTDEPIEMMGSQHLGASYANTVSERYGVPCKIAIAHTGAGGSKHVPLGLTLYGVQELDENGEKLLYNPRKAAEMGVAISGQAVPVLTKGIVLYSGAVLTSDSPVANVDVYTANNGELSTTSTNATKVGKTLGSLDDNNHVLLKIEL
jgi:hypothetical protein